MKPIFVSDAERQKLMAEIEEKLVKMKMFNGKLELNYEYSYNEKEHLRPILWYTPEAWTKMTALIDSFSGEVGWQGAIERCGEAEWIVTDIYVYPQTVTAAHVDTDELEYNQFLVDLYTEHENEEFCANFQGHSHVNMSVSPSGTDIADQKKRMEDQKTGYYVFTIQNKKREHNTWIYDYDNNIMYEPKDIDVDIMVDNDTTMSAFMADAKKLVVTQAPVTQQKPANVGYSYVSPKKEEKAKKDAYAGYTYYNSGFDW